MAALSASTGGCKYGLWLGLIVFAVRSFGGEYSRPCVTRYVARACVRTCSLCAYACMCACLSPCVGARDADRRRQRRRKARCVENVASRGCREERIDRMRARATRQTIAVRLLPRRCLTRSPFASSLTRLFSVFLLVRAFVRTFASSSLSLSPPEASRRIALRIEGSSPGAP